MNCDACGRSFRQATSAELWTPFGRADPVYVCEFPPVGDPSCGKKLCSGCVRYLHPAAVSGLQMSFCAEHHDAVKAADPAA